MLLKLLECPFSTSFYSILIVLRTSYHRLIKFLQFLASPYTFKITSQSTSLHKPTWYINQEIVITEKCTNPWNRHENHMGLLKKNSFKHSWNPSTTFSFVCTSLETHCLPFSHNKSGFQVTTTMFSISPYIVTSHNVFFDSSRWFISHGRIVSFLS